MGRQEAIACILMLLNAEAKLPGATLCEYMWIRQTLELQIISTPNCIFMSKKKAQREDNACSFSSHVSLPTYHSSITLHNSCPGDFYV
jgi:hypothetical protein